MAFTVRVQTEMIRVRISISYLHFCNQFRPSRDELRSSEEPQEHSGEEENCHRRFMERHLSLFGLLLSYYFPGCFFSFFSYFNRLRIFRIGSQHAQVYELKPKEIEKLAANHYRYPDYRPVCETEAYVVFRKCRLVYSCKIKNAANKLDP